MILNVDILAAATVADPIVIEVNAGAVPGPGVTKMLLPVDTKLLISNEVVPLLNTVDNINARWPFL